MHIQQDNAGTSNYSSKSIIKKLFQPCDDDCCFYCGLSQAESKMLYLLYPECTRGGRRGNTLERDRKDPSLPYSVLDNIVYACYWCNNAKSNCFTAEEFKPIGKKIGEANRKRLIQKLVTTNKNNLCKIIEN